MKRNKNVILRKRVDEPKSEPENPSKGPGTFSYIDSTNVGMPKKQASLEDLAERIVQAIKYDKNLTIVDDRGHEAPTINIETPELNPQINVEPTPIQINVQPTPYEIRIPTQRIQAPPAPDVHIENKIDLSHLIFIGYCHLLLVLIGVVVWLLQTLLNSP